MKRESVLEEIRLQSWNAFVDLIAEFDGWAFRGQEDARWPLISSLSRHLSRFAPDAESWRAREERAIRVFRRKAHNYLANPAVLDNDMRCLTLMQHHGAPTRLLDFTKSPFVAAFFALENASGDAAVYALNTPRLWSASPVHERSLTRDRIDPRREGNFERYFLSNEHEVLWVGEPHEMDRRLVAQSGTMVVPGVLNKPLDHILAAYPGSDRLLRKLVLPAAARDAAIKSLYRMNMTSATLFPDLDGLARSVRTELEVSWPVTPPGSGIGTY
jgi:hypothetical protein